MSSFRRWLHSLSLLLMVAALAGCQVLFGDFKVTDKPRASDGGQGGAAGNISASGGAYGTPSGLIRVVPTTDLYTSDSGGQTKFYVSLASRPNTSVTLPIVSSNTNEGTVSPASLSFTPEDWNAAQTVTVTGVHDLQISNQLYSVIIGPAKSDDKVFEGASTSVSITNIDNDSAGFFVTPTSGLKTSESGSLAVFTVVLNSQPTADVVISVTSNDENIGTVNPSSLKFTADNYRSPQTVTITGVNNDAADGDQAYTITVGPVASTDASYAKLPSQTVSVLNLDNDHAGVMVALATGIDPSDTTRLRTNENGDSATFTMALNKAPKSDVTIAISSSSDEGKVSPAALTFTPLNWAAPQTVTVIGLNNDNVADGDQPYQIKFGPVTSDDPAYSGLTSADLLPVNVVNVDNDKAGLTITLLTSVDPNDASQLQTTEKGAKATFSVALTSKPSDSVQLGLTSTNGNEGTINPSELKFTVDNWNVAQVVTVTGVDDDTKDGNVVYAVRISAPTTQDLSYQQLSMKDVKVVNLDDDVAGFTLPKLLSGIDGGTKLVTNESGNTATFSLSLLSKPSADVKVPITSSDTTEGKVSPTTLTFTKANYATPQVVTVTGVDDSMVDGNQAYTINIGPSTSDDENYVGLTQMVKVTNQDDDSAYIVPTPGYNGTTTEKGGSVSFGIALHSQPTAAVTLTFTSSDTNEGRVSPASLNFSTSNWATPQNITVTGVNDDIADGDKGYTIAVKGTNTTDANYMYAATTLTLTNTDDDVAQLKVTAAANLQTTEAGGKVTFTVALNSQPTANVTVAVSSSAVKEGTVSPASLSFTASNWSTPQTVTVTGVDDSIADGNQTYTVSLKASGNDSKYSTLPVSNVSIVNKDDDPVGITVTPTTCATTPSTTATFTVVLKSQPLGPVSIALSSDTPTEGKVSPATLSFTAMTWNVAQTVTVTGQDDGTTETMTAYKIITAAAVSALDTNYNGLNAADVSCVNTTPAAPPPPPPGP